MGNNDLRRLIKAESKWTDKEASRHKHEFSEEVNIAIIYGNHVAYYSAMKCKHCNSFKCISRDGSPSGILNEPKKELKTVWFKTKHKFRIGFEDLEYLSNVDVEPEMVL